MTRIFACACVSLLLIATSVPVRPTLAAHRHHSAYGFACNSHYFLGPEQVGGPPVLQKHPVVVSPDYRFQLRIQGYEEQSPSPEPFGEGALFVDVLSAGKPIATLRYYDVSSNVELGWSPDSTQFFVMYSDGYAIGQYHVHLLRIVGNHVVTSPAPKVVLERFQSRHSCFPGGGDNLYILNWSPDSQQVFLVAEVYPESYCGKQMGVYEGFLMDAVSGKILRRFGEKETSAIEKSCRTSGTLVLPKAG